MSNNIWALAVGAWGDSICAYGNMCNLLKQKGLEKCNVVCFGLDKNICEFFKAQPNVDKVSFLDISIPSVIAKYIELANTNFEEWMKVTGLDQQLPEIHRTHISRDWHNNRPTECYRDFACELPPCLADFQGLLDEPFVLFQPYSTNSCSQENHWQHWGEALDWLTKTTNKNIIVVGEQGSAELPLHHPKVKNLMGQTKSMLDVYHIANKADWIVTTSNSLSIWSILKNIPATVICNKVIKFDTPYYYNWIKAGENTVLDQDASFEDFVSAML